jgi:hypothetical protein
MGGVLKHTNVATENESYAGTGLSREGGEGDL